MLALGLLAGVFLNTELDVVRLTGGAVGASEVSVFANGDFGRPGPLPLAFRKGEAVRLMPGVPDREGGFEGRLMDGLSHDEKKSSPGSPAGVFVPVPSLSSLASSITTDSGYLHTVSLCLVTIPNLQILLLILFYPPREFILVLRCSVRGVLGLWVFACKRCATAIPLEVLCRALIATDLHPS